MKEILRIRSSIYNQFHGSTAWQEHFFKPENTDKYAAYYTSMYLIADTGEAVWQHMSGDFSEDPMRAYLEFWGVMQAIFIQQDAITELHSAVVGRKPNIQENSAWKNLRDKRNLCVGHPALADRPTPVQRTFMSRSFGNYSRIQFVLWNAKTRQETHPVFNLRKMIHDYDVEASGILSDVLTMMKSVAPGAD